MKHYSLSIEQKNSSIYIKMQMHTSVTTTSELPHTYDLLSKIIPGIHSSTCFNSKNLPFAKEVRNTEIGHLFEHILLEYLYSMRLFETKKAFPAVRGETSWNWNEEPYGLFHIKLNIDSSYRNVFPFALSKSISVLDNILERYA